MAAGAIAGLELARRRGDWRDLPAAVFAGGSLGLLGAAFWSAVLVTGERVLGPLSHSIGAVTFLSAILGGLLAVVSMFLFPYRRADAEAA